ncbi:acyltransferase [Fibrobacter sp.]|uniref:acyltransferase n=1 Tax=Fibrobacter sp. TaxID=35828 RepID=UPI00388EA0BA
MSETKQYNYCLDFIKGIACIFVVFMHCEFPGLLGTAVQTVSRFCVPLFFMVSGYFCFMQITDQKEINAKMKKKIRHIGKITLYACLAYLVFDVVQYFVFGNKSIFACNTRRFFDFFVLNKPVFVAGQYWFLFALLYDYFLFALILKLKQTNKIYTFVFLMPLLYVFLAQGLHLLGINVQNCVYRNFIVEGFAFFGLGYWIHANQPKLKISNAVLIVVVVVSTLLCFAERYLMGRDFGVNIVTFPQVFCLFLLAINNPQKHAGLMQIIGLRYSMFVYIIHPIVWHTMEFVYEHCGIAENMLAQYLMPIFVLFLTLLFSHIIYHAKNSSHISLHG